MDIQSPCHDLDLHARGLCQLHGAPLELQAVPLNLLRTDACGHSTPPCVKRKCLLYRGRFRCQLYRIVGPHCLGRGIWLVTSAPVTSSAVPAVPTIAPSTVGSGGVT